MIRKKGGNMDKYTKFILTMIAIAMIGILFKGEKIITSAHAIEKHEHGWKDIVLRFDDGKVRDLQYFVKEVVRTRCWARSGGARTSGPIFCE